MQASIRRFLPSRPVGMWLSSATHSDGEGERALARYRETIDREAARYARLGGSREDLQSEGALAVMEAIAKRDRTDFDAYVKNAIHRRVRRAYRTTMGFGRQADAPLDWARRMGAVERRYGESEARLDLERAATVLPSAEREAMTRYLELSREGLGPDEAADQLARERGGTMGAWKKRLQRGRRRLRRLYGDDGAGEPRLP